MGARRSADLADFLSGRVRDRRRHQRRYPEGRRVRRRPGLGRWGCDRYRVNSGTGSGTYDGNGVYYVEFGHRRVARVDITFTGGQPPYGHFDTASEVTCTEKDEFGASRLRRWIGAG